MNLKQQVVNTILSFEESFSRQDIYESLKRKDINVEENRGVISHTINATISSPLIKHVPFTNRYYNVEFKNNW